MFRYAAVIVTFNRLGKLKEEISSLLLQKVVPSKIVIVDNNSNVDTKIYCENIALSDSRIVYKRLEKNIGGSGGFYEGIKVAKNLEVDWIALSDDDALYDSHFFEYIKDKAYSNTDISCFTGTVRNLDGNIDLAHRRSIKNTVTLSQRIIDVNSYVRPFYLEVFSFVGVVIKKSLIEKIGLPEKDFFIWYDDTEYSLRVIQYTKILNVSDATIVHNTGEISFNKFKPSWKMYYGVRNNVITVKKHSKHSMIYKLLLPLIILKRYSLLLINHSYYRPYVKEMAYIYFKGFEDGILGRIGVNSKFLP